MALSFFRERNLQSSYRIYRIGLFLISMSLGCAPCPAAELKTIGDTVSEAVSKRRINEARARLIDRNLDQQDVQLLSDEEIDFSPTVLGSHRKSFLRLPSDQFPRKELPNAKSGFKYQYLVGSSVLSQDLIARDLDIDHSLARPEIEIDLSDPVYPLLRVPRLKGPAGEEALYYFEFDTTRTFDSPNSWRYPNLTPVYLKSDPENDAENPDEYRNLTSRAGLSLNVLGASQRNAFGTINEVRFPFRATAMRLPDRWDQLDFNELERQALALGYGLSATDTVAELYRYGRHAYSWGDDSFFRPVLDTFKAGIAECAAVNGLIAAMLEMNGIRARIVAGFNPKFRALYPDSGHSLIEVFDPQTGRWFVFDSYLDLLLPGVSTEDIAKGVTDHSKMPILEVVRPHHQGLFGQWLTLGQLFKYRKYSDTLTRLLNTSMLKL